MNTIPPWQQLSSSSSSSPSRQPCIPTISSGPEHGSSFLLFWEDTVRLFYPITQHNAILIQNLRAN